MGVACVSSAMVLVPINDVRHFQLERIFQNGQCNFEAIEEARKLIVDQDLDVKTEDRIDCLAKIALEQHPIEVVHAFSNAGLLLYSRMNTINFTLEEALRITPIDLSQAEELVKQKAKVHELFWKNCLRTQRFEAIEFLIRRDVVDAIEMFEWADSGQFPERNEICLKIIQIGDSLYYSPDDSIDYQLEMVLRGNPFNDSEGEKLLQSGAKVHEIFWKACLCFGRWEAIEFLIKRDVVDAIDMFEWADSAQLPERNEICLKIIQIGDLLHEAIASEDFSVVVRCIELGADLDAADKSGVTARKLLIDWENTEERKDDEGFQTWTAQAHFGLWSAFSLKDLNQIYSNLCKKHKSSKILELLQEKKEWIEPLAKNYGKR